MTNTPDPALLLACKIADSKYNAGTKPVSWMIARDAALAAIRETTELAARYIDLEAEYYCGLREGSLLHRHTKALRANRHLEKGSTDDHYPDC